MTPTHPTAEEIAKEAVEGIARDMDIYVSGSPLPDKYQAAKQYFTPTDYAQSFVMKAARRIAAQMVRETGAEPWRKCAESLPEIPVIVWVSKGGGSALLARYDRYRWEDATSIKPLPFSPIWWKPLTLPESPGPLRALTGEGQP